MYMSIYRIIFRWLNAHPLEIIELPNGGFLQNASGYALLYDKNGDFVREAQLSEDAMRDMLIKAGIKF